MPTIWRSGEARCAHLSDPSGHKGDRTTHSERYDAHQVQRYRQQQRRPPHRIVPAVLTKNPQQLQLGSKARCADVRRSVPHDRLAEQRDARPS